ncbi:MAG: retropepsin-like aspartic protease [Vampirovibrionales bacterium]|nr:retropepsin-like aspartic protease [Vampirovibrionales bacterium]
MMATQVFNVQKNRNAFQRATSLCLVSAICLLQALPAFATEASSDVSNTQQEAAVFFTNLAHNSANPYIASWAKESLSRLEQRKAPRKSVTEQPNPVKREVSVSLLRQNNNSLAVPTLLNRKSMGTFLIDTGASYTVITPRLAQKLGIAITPDLPRISIITANGVVKAPIVTVDSILIGEMEVKNVKAIVQDLGSDLLLAGLLGMNFFQGMDMSVKQNTLILSVNTP